MSPYQIVFVEIKDEHTNSTFQVFQVESILALTPCVEFGPTSLITSQARKNHDYPQPQGTKEFWNCFGSKLRSSMRETPGDKQE
ncbi:hypothetical protein CR513_23817, partial [Mucuna pruriens]